MATDFVHSTDTLSRLAELLIVVFVDAAEFEHFSVAIAVLLM